MEEPVRSTGSPELARAHEGFVAVVEALKAALADMLAAFNEGKFPDLGAARDRVLDMAGLVEYLHKEQKATSGR